MNGEVIDSTFHRQEPVTPPSAMKVYWQDLKSLNQPKSW